MRQKILPGVLIIAVVLVGFTWYTQQRKEKEVQRFYDTYTETKVKDQYKVVMQKAFGTTYNMDSLKRLVYDTTRNNVQRLIILSKADSATSRLKY